VNVPEPGTRGLMFLGLLFFVGWIAWERAKRNRYLGEERRRKERLFLRPEDVQ
jgi:PEP-CTERM putative exosortase interaction domain